MDPISDMLTRIRNAQSVGREKVLVPFAKIRFELGKILAQERFINKIERIKYHKKDFIEIILKYDQEHRGAISNLKRISKPGQRIYLKHQKIRPVRQGYGIAIISTPQGLMADKEARKQRLGGEVIAEVW